MRRYSLLFLFFFLAMVSLTAMGAAKVETVQKPKESPVPDAIWSVLDSNGYRVSLDDGTVIDIWLRKDIPSSGKKEMEGSLYPELNPSAMIGVISYPKEGSDFRGQTIRPGFYTMRYELLPNDANHLGVSPNRDFVLLVPVASDPDPKTELKYADLMNLSRKASGTPHPSPLSIVQAADQPPAVTKDDQDHWIFSGKLRFAAGEEIPFGLIVKGVAQQ